MEDAGQTMRLLTGAVVKPLEDCKIMAVADCGFEVPIMAVAMGGRLQIIGYVETPSECSLDSGDMDAAASLFAGLSTTNGYDVMVRGGNVGMRMWTYYIGRSASEVSDLVSCFIGRMMGLALHLYSIADD